MQDIDFSKSFDILQIRALKDMLNPGNHALDRL